MKGTQSYRDKVELEWEWKNNILTVKTIIDNESIVRTIEGCISFQQAWNTYKTIVLPEYKG